MKKAISENKPIADGVLEFFAGRDYYAEEQFEKMYAKDLKALKIKTKYV